MKYYERADGTRCRAIQFKGREEEASEALWIITFLNDQEIRTYWVAEEATDEWFENEDGEPEQKIIPEHLRLVPDVELDEEGVWRELGVDHCYLGDYIVERDGEYYVTNKDIFEAIYAEVKA